MSQTRYRLTTQLHFLADTPHRPDVVVTVQRWDSISTRRPSAVYVVCFNGEQQTRRLCTTTEQLSHLTQVMARTEAEHHDTLMSEERAATEVVERGGPRTVWCHRRKECGEPVPYAAGQCAAGHPVESVGRVEFLSVTQRRPALTVHTGGQSRG